MSETSADPGPLEPDPLTFAGHPATDRDGELTVYPPREELVKLARQLRDEGWLMCLDVTAVDYLTFNAPRDLPALVGAERFEVTSLFINHRNPARLRITVQVPEGDLTVPTLFEVHPGTEALEREVFDMFGIDFEGHPDLTRVLMPEDWVGHPLRKDYDVGRIPVQFKDDPGPR